MRIVFMGTPDFAVPAFEALNDSEHEIIAAVTQPDRPKGRGKAPGTSPIKEAALKAGVPLLQPESARDASFAGEIDKLSPDICVVAAYGQILPADLLNIPQYGCVNIHASLLPRYRGASPIQWAIINGDEESGVTTMQMDAGMDTGDILEQSGIKLDPKETAGTLTQKLSRLGGKLILSTLERLSRGSLIPQKQDSSQAVTVRKIDKSMGEIDFSDQAVRIERLIRALNPSPGAFAIYEGKRIKIWEADAIPDDSGSVAGFPCGTILKAAGDELDIQTGDGILQIGTLQLEGKKKMDTASFLRGFPLHKGDKLGR